MTVVAAPTQSGLDHVKIPIVDLETGLAWYREVFGAEHLVARDDFDSDGARYAALLSIRGVPLPVELGWAPDWALALYECDVVVLAVDSADQLGAWIEHLGVHQVLHSPIVTAGGGPVVVIVDPHGKFIRLMPAPPGGVAAQTLPREHAEPEGPWLNPAPTRHPQPMKAARQPAA